MFTKTNETKVMRDPIHGYIHVDLQVVWDCINSAWFQRLRRIRQLCGVGLAFHGAEHTRFSHCLGVYEVVRRMVNEIDDIANTLNEREKVVVMLAGLLHDIGHGPFSHSFEGVIKTSHEEFSCRIIEEGTEITEILNKADPNLAKDVADVIRKKSSNQILCQMISSQLDADRMDYLLRDTYYTGVTYGNFDLERILRVIRIIDNQMVIKQSGVYAVENYIMARYHMYWQVYFHPTARSFEVVLHSLFARIEDVYKEDPNKIPEVFKPVFDKGEISLEDYFGLDEDSCIYGFQQLLKSDDPILKDLSARLLNRDLFVDKDYHSVDQEKLRKALKEKGYDERYYFGKEIIHQLPYVPYTGNSEDAIWVLMNDGSTKELEDASSIVHSLVHATLEDENRIFFPRGLSLD